MKTKITLATSLLTGATIEFHEPIFDDVVGVIEFPSGCPKCGHSPCLCYKFAPIVQTARQRMIHRVLFG